MISVCIPYVRPNKMIPLINQIMGNSGISPYNLEILTDEDTERIGCPKMLKKLVDRSTGDYICFLGDDVDPQPGFLYNALFELGRQLMGSGLVGLHDQTERKGCQHWLASRDMLELLDGEFFHTGYTHTYCDVELYTRCVELNKFYHSETSIVLHNHPLLDHRVPTDADYQRVYSKPIQRADKALYYKRKANGWPK